MEQKKKAILFIKEIWNRRRFSQPEDLEWFIHFPYRNFEESGISDDPWELIGVDFDDYRQRVQFLHFRFAKIKFDIRDVIEEGDRVGVRWNFTGNYDGIWSKTEDLFELPGFTLFYFKDEKIIGHRQWIERKVFLDLEKKRKQEEDIEPWKNILGEP